MAIDRQGLGAMARRKAADDKWYFGSGGNPPIHAGVFTSSGERLAWWPAGYMPTTDRMDIAYRLIIAREDDEPVSRSTLAIAFNAAGRASHAA